MNEAYEAVKILNNEMIDKNPILEGDYFIDLHYCSTGGYDIIKYLDIIIWSEEDDSRDFYEDKNEYESMYKYLKREIKRINKTIGSLKV